MRRRQLAAVHGLMRFKQQELGFDHAIVTGDLNMQGAFEEEYVHADFADVWTTLRPNEPGYTWDSTINSFGIAMWGPLALHARNIQWRLDRMLLYPSSSSSSHDDNNKNNSEVRPLDIEIVANESIGLALWPSDHFGLRATFAVHDKASAAAAAAASTKSNEKE
eukprot:TRINITY_DN58204_c0_g1_i1.p1 TRINITY_DN58204_c0_g1~~TRINITY_DN58204_c0_g1_i1.p1  ORF type:complete len:164 (-),score=78.53 TRINITY_DN58204_c0_g1_i1:633-1124(-)